MILSIQNRDVQFENGVTFSYPVDRNSILIEGGIDEEMSVKERVLYLYKMVVLSEDDSYEFSKDIPEDVVLSKLKEDFSVGGNEYVLAKLYIAGEADLQPDIGDVSSFNYDTSIIRYIDNYVKNKEASTEYFGIVKDVCLPFEDMMKEVIEEKPYVAKYLTDLQEKSPVTFNHSIKVAALTFYELSKKNEFFYDDLKTYVSAALVHDAGKLTTPNEILHSKSFFGAKSKEEADRHYTIMMRHSIDSLDIAKDYGFSKEEVAVCIAHHIDDRAMESGLEGGFEGATKSRWCWKESFGIDGYIENMLMRELAFASKKDFTAISVISFCDVIEALRSGERSYTDAKPWGHKVDCDLDRKPTTVCEIVWTDVKNYKMNPSFEDEVVNEQFRSTCDIIENSQLPEYAMEIASKVVDKLNVKEIENVDRDDHLSFDDW